MLVLHKGKRVILSVLAAVVFAVPVAVFAINKSMEAEDTYAATWVIYSCKFIDETYTMPEGFNDQNFYDCIVHQFKGEFGNEEIPETGLTDEQLARITALSFTDFATADVTGLEKLTGLTYLNLSHNKLKDIDLSSNTSLSEVYLGDNDLGSIDVSHNLSLKVLDVEDNEDISSINLEANALLEELYVNECNFEDIDVRSNNELKKLDVSYNSLTSLDLRNNHNLRTLWAARNQINDIKFPTDSLLTAASLGFNELESIDLNNLSNLKVINVGGNQLNELSVRNNPELVALYVGCPDLSTHSQPGAGSCLNSGSGKTNHLTSIDVTHNPKLVLLDVSMNMMNGTIDVSHNPELTSLYVGGGSNNLGYLDLTLNTKMETIIAERSNLSSLIIPEAPSLKNLYISENNFSKIDVSNMPSLEILAIEGNDISEIDVSHNENLSTLISDNILVEAGLEPVENGSYVYDLSGLKFMKDHKTDFFISTFPLGLLDDEYWPLGGANSYRNWDLSINIEDTDDYSYDKDNGLLEILNPEAVGDGVPVVEGIPYYVLDVTHYREVSRFRLKLFDVVPVGHATTIAYHGNGGGYTCDNDSDGVEDDWCELYEENVLAGESTNIGNGVTFERNDHNFVGWNTKADGTGISYTIGDEFTAPEGEDNILDLYAQWEEIEDEEDITVPNTAAPETGVGGFMKENGALMMMCCGWVLLSVGFIILMVVCHKRKKRCEIESL